MTQLAAELRAQEDALRRQFSLRQPQWLASASVHIGTLRPQLETLQQAYPPRVRCDLGAIPDDAIARRLHAALAPALAKECERLLGTQPPVPPEAR